MVVGGGDQKRTTRPPKHFNHIRSCFLASFIPACCAPISAFWGGGGIAPVVGLDINLVPGRHGEVVSCVSVQPIMQPLLALYVARCGAVRPPPSAPVRIPVARSPVPSQLARFACFFCFVLGFFVCFRV